MFFPVLPIYHSFVFYIDYMIRNEMFGNIEAGEGGEVPAIMVGAMLLISKDMPPNRVPK